MAGYPSPAPVQPAQFLVCTPDDLMVGFWLGVLVAFVVTIILIVGLHHLCKD